MTTSLFWHLVVDLPLLITLVVCMAFVFMRWKRFPRAAWLALIGLILLLLHALVFSAIYALAMPSRFVSYAKMFGIDLINFTAMAFAFTFLLIAVFAARSQPSETAG